MRISREQLAKMIDSTNVKATATRDEIEVLCREAVQYSFRCVCVNPVCVRFAVSLLKGSSVKVSSTVGFPFGASLSETKASEARKALEDGASELDMVVALSALKSGNYEEVRQDMIAVVNTRHVSKKIIVKAIIETACLTDEEKIVACRLAKEAGVDFVKTSTGFFGRGANVEDVRLIRQTVGKNFGVKAAGGIRTYSDAVAMIEAGADRIGTSSAVAVIQGAPT